MYKSSLKLQPRRVFFLEKNQFFFKKKLYVIKFLMEYPLFDHQQEQCQNDPSTWANFFQAVK